MIVVVVTDIDLVRDALGLIGSRACRRAAPGGVPDGR
jgi:hypothetical protein